MSRYQLGKSTRCTQYNYALYSKTFGSAINSIRTMTDCGSKATSQLVIKHAAANTEYTSNSSTTSRWHYCINWDHRWRKLNSITLEISFCFKSFHLQAIFYEWITLVTLREHCICTQLHVWTVLPPTDIGQLLSHPSAHNRLLWCETNLQHTAACHISLCHCISAGPACSLSGEWLAERTAHKHTSGPIQNQSRRHERYTVDSAGALSPNPPARTIACFNYGTLPFWIFILWYI